MAVSEEGRQPARQGEDAPVKGPSRAGGEGRPPCCPYYHQAVELIGRRWTGAIVGVLILIEVLRFGEIA